LATNLGGDCPSEQCAGLYLRDRVLATTTPVAVVPTSAVSTGGSYGATTDLWNPDVSDDGRFVAFHTNWAGFDGRDTNDDYDVYLYDVLRKTYERISVASDGSEGHAPAVETQRVPASVRSDNFPGSKHASI